MRVSESIAESGHLNYSLARRRKDSRRTTRTQVAAHTHTHTLLSLLRRADDGQEEAKAKQTIQFA